MNEKSAVPEEKTAESAPTSQERPFALLFAAAFGVTCGLALVLFLLFAAFGFAGAPYASVGAAVVGGVVMRRMLLRAPTGVQVALFTACTIAGALAGLWLGEALWA